MKIDQVKKDSSYSIFAILCMELWFREFIDDEMSWRHSIMELEKEKMFDFWNSASCGEELLLESTDVFGFEKQLLLRYELEPYIKEFAGFESSGGKKVLEIGTGLGADHQMFAENGAILYGIDLTPRAIKNTNIRFNNLKLNSNLSVGDAENLSFEDSYFDIVYSWGVIHHSPDTEKQFQKYLGF